MEEYVKTYKRYKVTLRKSNSKWSCFTCPKLDMKARVEGRSIIRGGFNSKEDAVAYAVQEIDIFLQK